MVVLAYGTLYHYLKSLVGNLIGRHEKEYIRIIARRGYLAYWIISRMKILYPFSWHNYFIGDWTFPY